MLCPFWEKNRRGIKVSFQSQSSEFINFEFFYYNNWIILILIFFFLRLCALLCNNDSESFHFFCQIFFFSCQFSLSFFEPSFSFFEGSFLFLQQLLEGELKRSETKKRVAQSPSLTNKPFYQCFPYFMNGPLTKDTPTTQSQKINTTPKKK